jgi:hypothetical protein
MNLMMFLNANQASMQAARYLDAAKNGAVIGLIVLAVLGLVKPNLVMSKKIKEKMAGEDEAAVKKRLKNFRLVCVFIIVVAILLIIV